MGERVLQIFGKLDRNGAETMLMNIYRKINRDKVQFDFVVHTEEVGDYEQEILDLGGRIFRCPRYRGDNHFAYRKWWKNFFQEYPYKIIHSHIRSTASLYIPIYHKYCNGIAIAHSHSTSSGSGIASIVKNALQLPLRFEADYLFACSENAGKWLFGKKVLKKGNFYLLKNAIDSEQYEFNQYIRETYRRNFGIDDQLVIGHVGRFVKEKNHRFLIKIFEEVYKENPQVILMLVGRGELQDEIRTIVKDKQLEENVIFLGNRDDVPKLMQAMDIFVFPSLFEGLGMVAVEAQASGLITICSENIPEEAMITDLIYKEKLDAGAKHFARVILDKVKNNAMRKSYKESITESGWDISYTTKWLEDFYLKHL